MVHLPKKAPALCLVIGDPISHSLSPALHNAIYQELGIAKEFVYSAAHVLPDNLADAIRGMRALGLRGLSLTLPHKIAILPLLDELDDAAKRLGAVNTVVNNAGVLRGYNTDAEGILSPLHKAFGNLSGKHALVFGAGGAGRCAALSLAAAGAQVDIVNRTQEKGESLARECSGSFFSPDKPLQKRYDILIQASSLGLGASQETPAPDAVFHKDCLAFETVYAPLHTPFVRQARQAGAKVILGSEMFATQACAQVKLFTGYDFEVEQALQMVTRLLEAGSAS